MRKIVLYTLLVLLAASCRTLRRTPDTVACLASKVEVTLPLSSGTLSLGGSLKLRGGERLVLSVQMPVLRTEAVRLELTPDEVLLVDRLNRRYVRASRADLEPYLPDGASFRSLERRLLQAAEAGTPVTLDGGSLGLPGELAQASLRLYDFSQTPFELSPTTLSDRYRAVSVAELIGLLRPLL